MKLVVGLGNPLPKYKGTRHNVGQTIVSYFQEVNNFPKFQLKKKLESLISEGKIGGEKIILVLPQTFMNESGRAVQKLITNYKLSRRSGPAPTGSRLGGETPPGRWPITNLLVIHDDIDLPLGKIRIKTDGSSGGHNGVQSIIDHLKTENFIRIKIGVANEKRDLIPAEKFVLEKFDKEEKELMDRVIKRGTEIICDILNKDIRSQTFSI